MMPYAVVDSTQVDVVRRLVSLAYEFGPFLFTILFLVFVTGWVQKSYKDACRRTEPPAKDEEMRARKNIYYSTWIVTFVLTAVSTGWWILHKSGSEENRTFTFAIQALNYSEDLQLRDEELYTRKVTRWGTTVSEGAVYTQYFALVGTGVSEDEPGFELTYHDTRNDVQGVIVFKNEMNGKKFVIEKKAGRAVLEKDNIVALREAGKIRGPAGMLFEPFNDTAQLALVRVR